MRHPDPSRDAIEPVEGASADARFEQLLRRRLRSAALCALPLAALYGLAESAWGPALPGIVLPLGSAALAACGLVLAATARWPGRWLATAGVAAASALVGSACAIALAGGDASGSSIWIGSVTLGAAIHVPWGASWQSVLAAGSLAALAATRVALGGSWEVAWSLSGTDPFLGLAIAASPLLARSLRSGLRRIAELEEARERLADRFHRELEGARRELERRGLALEQALEEAEKADLSKARFLAAVSHELRTPLTAILGFAGMLRSGAAGPVTPKQLDYATEICTSAEHLLHLVRGILDHARIEGDEDPLQLAEVPIDLLVEVACRQVAPAALEKNLAIRRPPRAGARVVADRQKLLQVLLNLLSNAIKFSDPGSEIGVDVAVRGELVELAVWDRGVGIAAGDLERIFRPFEQVDGANRASKKGTGLGLAICRSLVERHGGTIRAESEPGRGTRVVVRLPRTPAGCQKPSPGPPGEGV